ncbi:MerC domain-containing protein [Sphingomonas adhaesiva]|uniref:MerC domain-containing protein n=1 Tax=Sphingomonas adhaesiva TaxID=28212 RepID=UPI002FF9A206
MPRPAASSDTPSRLDRWAMWVSAACVVHCLATTMAVAALSAAGGILGSPLIHEAGLVIAILLGAIAFGRGIATHGRALPMALGTIGLALMASALLVSHEAHHLAETGLTILGVSVLALGHAVNRRAHC